MRLTMTLAISGRAGPFVVLADEALEAMLDRITGTDAPKVTVTLGGLSEVVPIVKETARIEELPGGHRALRAALEVPDGVFNVPTPEPVSAFELTEADRAEQMRRLEQGPVKE